MLKVRGILLYGCRMSTTYCQSCAMPIGPDEAGTEADGSGSHEFCKYCYQGGAYTDDITMDAMIEICVSAMAEVHPDMPAEQARAHLAATIPTLKRWVQ